MSTFLNCQHCSHQIHETAPACPKCGAPATKASSPVSNPNNKIMWTLAFAPLIGLFVESIVAGVFAPSQYYAMQDMAASKYWYISLILNISLCMGDEAGLKKDGINTANFGKFSILVPVYLWKRAKAFNHSPAYFWTWIGTFVFVQLSTAFIGG
ncbi:hypothetical protein DBR37_04625 [Herminiimonas sp. KBW02]|uniref:Zinc ribbon protein n=1 Tax=Herminiimonas glaciei TaxID=523788 RepID=A0ABW2I629_9BURK|nr:hypothetical protein [Herminiimonas sp. KBW02]RQO35667.1 hypothetical protein DBR37_04625 [Herminiimonas sp. KBW02]